MRAIVRALTPGNGRSNRCEAEDELLQRLDSDGVMFAASNLSAALSLLEANGHQGYDIGSLPGLP